MNPHTSPDSGGNSSDMEKGEHKNGVVTGALRLADCLFVWFVRFKHICSTTHHVTVSQ